MKLLAPTQQHLLEMMSWFGSEDALREWAGPSFSYPFSSSSFAQDLNLDSLDSFSLVSDAGELLAFGQCYLRVGRCHLGRLVVSPEHRGKNVVANLMRLLMSFGMKKFEVDGCSLFVYEDNQSGIKAYLKAGFKFADYPEEMPMQNCLYMVKEPRLIQSFPKQL